MNDERAHVENRLLTDVFCDEPNAKQAAVAAFRRAVFLRRARRVAGTMVICAAAATAIVHQTEKAPVIAVKKIVQPAAVPSSIPSLSDEQLLALFPSNSCFLAEVDGRQILVFDDPELREKFLFKRR